MRSPRKVQRTRAGDRNQSSCSSPICRISKALAAEPASRPANAQTVLGNGETRASPDRLVVICRSLGLAGKSLSGWPTIQEGFGRARFTTASPGEARHNTLAAGSAMRK